jgi:diguanylate cyclase (GGDEF)-like protein
MDDFTVLIADPNPDDLDSFKKKLEQNSFEVVTAKSEEECYSHSDYYDVGIYIIESVFPDAEPLNLCRYLRKRNYNQPVQIIVISKKNSVTNITTVVEAGGDDFIAKPVEPEEFVSRIEAAGIRLQKQISLFREREFYKHAVKQEEELSSRILNQNLYLKRAYQDMINVNRELEKTNSELEKIAKYDYLSGLLSRMNLFAVLDIEIDRAIRTKSPLSGIMMDIDNFKRINDNYGHQVGDEVIKDIGRKLMGELRKYDHAGRYGGEEFFIVLPNTDIEQALAMGERMRKELEKDPLRFDDYEIQITASLGIAQFREGETRESWINRADRAMYLAKEKGRNKVISD